MATLLESRAGVAKLGVPLMITSFVVVGGFMFWLSVTAKPTEVVLPDPEDVFENVVTLREFASGPNAYVDRMVSLENIQVGDPFGHHFYWTNLPDEQNNAYLLHLSDSLRADTTTLSKVRRGAIVTLTGFVLATTDSIVDEWAAAGAFKIPVEKRVAQSTFHLTFLEVMGIKLPRGYQPSQGDGSGS